MITPLQATSSFLYYMFLVGSKMVDTWSSLSHVVSAPLPPETVIFTPAELLTETNTQKPDLISIVADELRTPLTSLRAASEILYDNPTLNLTQRQQFLSIILQESEKLTQAVNHTLALLDNGLPGSKGPPFQN
ncbi:MAG: histidine kinase dimerization/phospho-acceptor domain-containing protein [Anaerolineae bacterium]